jgi:hypothetical protein
MTSIIFCTRDSSLGDGPVSGLLLLLLIKVFAAQSSRLRLAQVQEVVELLDDGPHRLDVSLEVLLAPAPLSQPHQPEDLAGPGGSNAPPLLGEVTKITF